MTVTAELCVTVTVTAVVHLTVTVTVDGHGTVQSWHGDSVRDGHGGRMVITVTAEDH